MWPFLELISFKTGSLIPSLKLKFPMKTETLQTTAKKISSGVFPLIRLNSVCDWPPITCLKNY